MALAGDLCFNPMTDSLKNSDGVEVKLEEPLGLEMPAKGYAVEDAGYQEPAKDGSNVEVIVSPISKRLQLLEPFPAWEGFDLKGLRLLIKVKGKCTTDHISMAGPWLMYRGHLDNISENLLRGAINAFTDKSVYVHNQLTHEIDTVATIQRYYKSKNMGSIVVGEENYGEGSSREHAAMEPRHLGVRVILVKSFARIHETNLKKQGLVPLTFADPKTYEAIGERDTISVLNLPPVPDKPVQCVINKADGTKVTFEALHTFSDEQVEWFKAGSALNIVRRKVGAK